WSPPWTFPAASSWWTPRPVCSTTSADMRVDVVTIFPEYLAPLELSLIGKARQDGLLQLKVHDLRDFTTDRHRTVDDTPYGGGAGMVMKPEPWAQALESLVTDSPAADTSPVVDQVSASPVVDQV